MMILLTAMSVVVAAMQQVHERAGQENEVRNHAEHVGAMLLPEQHNGHEPERDKDPRPRRPVGASGAVCVVRAVHDNLRIRDGTHRATLERAECLVFGLY